MNIGDKVRLLHSNEQGVVSKILDNQIIEVEIEDGFHIPVKKSELVVVSQEEDRQFGNLKNATKNESKIQPNESKVIANKGIFLAFLAINDKLYAFHLINNTDFDLPFQIGEEKNMNYKGLMAGVLKSRTNHKIGELNMQEFDNWSIYVFQFLFFSHGYHTLREPISKRVRLRANTFFKSIGIAPVLQKEGYVIQIDQDEKVKPAQVEETLPIDTQKIKEQMFEKNNVLPETPKTVVKKPSKEVDLHIEAITNAYEKMNSAEILQLQLQIFENSLENALASGMNEIVFIHGIGNGKLRHEIHRRLSGHQDIKFFEDARKEKFGYGATLVVFK